MGKGRKGKKGRRKVSTWGKVKGAIYAGSVAAPGAIAFQQFGGMNDPVKSASHTLMAYGGMNKDGKFDLAVLTQMWAPVASVAVVDLVSSKLKVQSRISNGIRGFLR